MITDYMVGVSATWSRNPNYYRTDPFFPENQLPYVDKVVRLVIADESTRLAALRTGKTDWMGGRYPPDAISWETAATLQKTHPQLKHSTHMTDHPWGLGPRNDTPPFDDVRVRQAMTMAIDYDTLIETLYGGRGVISKPYIPSPENELRWGTPWEELPEIVHKMYSYDPEGAKKLLAEAGYPDGFETHVITEAIYADKASVLQAYLADIGIDMEIRIVEPAAYTTMVANKTHTQIAWADFLPTTFDRLIAHTPGNGSNRACVDDPNINQWIEEAAAAFPDLAKRDAVLKKAALYIMEHATYINLPSEYIYTFWWPYVKGFEGGFTTGYSAITPGLQNYLWIDQDLKKEMLGR
jgi:peptide/nickel transport system substrate-binding protein